MYIQDVDLKLRDWAFAQRKNLPYEAKLSLTETRIFDFSSQFDTYVSFSGGLDSTVLLHFVRKYLGDEIPAVFVNTGLEYPEIVDFALKQKNVVELKPEMSFLRVLREYGYPFPSKETATKIRKLRHGNLSERYRNYLMNGDERGKMGKLPECWKPLIGGDVDFSEKCCDVMKKKPFNKYQKETGRMPFLGITQDESYMRRRIYEKTGCNILDGKHPQSKPLGFWTKQDILRYVVENNLEYCPVYGEIKQDKNGEYYTTGVKRTGCVYCLFGVHLESEPNRFQKMAKTHPDLYDYCMRGGEYVDGVFKPKNGLGYRELQRKIGVKLELDEQITFESEVGENEN